MGDKLQEIKDQEMNAYKALGSLDQNDIIATSELSSVFSAIHDDLSCKLDKRDGGEISGNVKLLCCDLSVDHGKFVLQNDSKFIANGTDLELYDSNYKQVSIRFSSTGDELEQRVYNLSPHNSFIQSEEAYPGSNIDGSYGVACTGYRGFCVLRTDTQLKTIKLSGSPSDLAFPASTKTISDEIAFTMQPGFDLSGGWSFTYGGSGNNRNINVLSIISGDISSFTISVDVTPTVVSSETEAIKQWNGGDENGFYYIPNITKYTNFEAEKVIGDFFENRRDKDIVTLFGNQNIACFNGAHAEGGSSKAIGKYSHAEGRGSIAEGRYSHAEGSFNHAAAIYSHAEGNYTYAGSNTAHAEGSKTKANGTNSHAEGQETTAAAANAHAEGLSSYAAGTASHAEGFNTRATGNYAHAEGFNTRASGRYAHAEGEQTQAVTDNAHAAGFMSYAGGWNSTAIGRYSKVKDADHNAFVWQGAHQSAYYESRGPGTFNINPANGISGFWIGAKNLGQYINEISSSITGIRADYALKTEAEAMSAYALQQASSYTNTVSSNLSTAFISTIDIISGETLVSAQSYACETSANALDDAKTYVDEISANLCATTDARLSDLSDAISVDYSEKIAELKTNLKEKLSAVHSLSNLNRDSTIEAVGIDAVLSLRDILSSLIGILD